MRKKESYTEKTEFTEDSALCYFEFLDFFFLWSLARIKLDSARSRKVATEFVRLIDSVSNLSAATATLFANRRIRLRAFLLKRKGPPIVAIITLP